MVENREIQVKGVKMSKEGKAIITAITIIPTIILTFCFPPAGITLIVLLLIMWKSKAHKNTPSA